MKEGLKLYRNSGLGPQRAPTKEVLKYERRKNFAECIRHVHKNQIRTKTEQAPPTHLLELEKKKESRRKQLEYAKAVPIPAQVQRAKNQEVTRGHVGSSESDNDLNSLLSRHRAEQARVSRLRALGNIK
jgi:hypothetical protein